MGLSSVCLLVQRLVCTKVYVCLALFLRAKKKLGVCVKVSPHCVEVFSKIMLLFSLTNDLWGEEENEFSQIM